MIEDSLKRKRILITGITGNLGQAAEKVFQNADWRVEGVSRETGVDLTNWGWVTEYIDRKLPYDLVFMTHGTQEKVLVKDFDHRTLDNIIGNNLISAIVLSRTLVRYGKLNPGGLIVYCSSIQAAQPREGRGLYCIAKAGLEGLARIMAVEMTEGRRAIALRLGQMTGQMKGITFDEVEAGRIEKRTPLPWVSFEDTGRFVLELYNQPSITGEVIEISSGHKFSIWPE